MTFLTQGRLTGTSIALLRQLAEPDALVFATARDEGDTRFYCQRGLQHFIVPERTVDVLAERGYILKCSSPVPLYRITDRGRAYLRVTGGRVLSLTACSQQLRLMFSRSERASR
jgi:hypothetical protein